MKHVKHCEPLVKHHEPLVKHCEPLVKHCDPLVKHHDPLVKHHEPLVKHHDGRSQWGTGTRETEVRLDGWCEASLRQQINDGGGCATMSEISERVESPGT